MSQFINTIKKRLYAAISLIKKTRAQRICFVLNSEEMITHYRGIWSQINPDEFDIVYGYDVSGETKKLIEQFCHQNNYRCYFIGDVLNIGIPYKTLVAHHYGACSSHQGHENIINALAKNKIRMIYGLGKNAWMFSNENSVFDFHLVYGNLAKKLTERFVSNRNAIFKIGYPRFDVAYSASTNDIKNRLGLNFKEKIIAWLPTHTVSSIPDFVETMSTLNETYKVIAKTHSMESDENIALLKKHDITLIEDHRFNNALLIKAADFIFCDYGGSMFGAIYMEKNLVLLNSLENAYQHDDNNDFKIFKKDPTSDTSLDVEMRKKVINFDKTVSAEKIMCALQDDSIWTEQITKLEPVKNDLFEPYYGFSSKIAAEVITNIHSGQQAMIKSNLNEIVEEIH